jgi:hypothetical protein
VESDIQGIGCLLNEASQDLTRRNHKSVISELIPANVHQLNEAALPAARNCKASREIPAVEFLVVDLTPGLPVRRRLDGPQFQMTIAQTITVRANCRVSGHDPPLIEIAVRPIVSRVAKIF